MAAKDLYLFTLAIGDESGDGHGKCDYYEIRSAIGAKEVEKAYRKAQKLMPKINPARFFEEYEQDKLDPEQIQALKETDAPCLYDGGYDHEYPWCSTENLARYFCWYVNKACPEANLSVAKNPPSLDVDIGGYGLFGA